MSAITAPKGFVAGGIHAGLKASGQLDLSLIATADGRPVSAAAVFTSNRLAAAPVQVSRAHLATSAGRAAGVIINSGNANAATGLAGYGHAEQMCALTAAELHCQTEEVLVCSTGLIGIPLPFDLIATGIPRVSAVRSAMGGADAAAGIMTTDTLRKEVIHQGSTFKVGAMAKGAGMLQPNMATMLAFLTTDAQVEPAELHVMLRLAVDRSFNRLTIDGAQSTNDTVIALASGQAGPADPSELQGALDAVCSDLALQMADDAEGSTKTVIIRVEGAADDLQALHGARSVANNQLAKCSWYGKNAYWGRVAAAIGASGIEFDPDGFTISYGSTVTAKAGLAVDFDEAEMAEYFENRRIHITTDLALGDGSGEIITIDLGHGYVDENMGKS
jgi:glutamate N-acetyltransferase/amino-acid N-acetyltransferase